MDNLFSAEWTMGDLSSIGSIKDILAMISVTVISFVGFFIVVSSIMKNALAGLYCTYPKLFDQINVAHRKKGEGGASPGSGGKFKASNILESVKGIKLAIFGLLPDVKVLTEFQEGDNIDPKHYFMNSLPGMVIAIFVGVFIFYRYPAKVAEKFADVATKAIDVTLLNVDPTTWVDSLLPKFAKPDFATNGLTDDVNSAVNDISKKVWTKYVGTFSDMTKERRKAVGNKIEQWVITNSNGISSYFNKDKFRMSIEVGVYTEGEPDLSKIHGAESNGIYTFAFSHDMASWEPGTTMATDNTYIAYYLTFTPVASKNKVTEVDNVMVVKAAVLDTSKKKITIQFGNAGNADYIVMGNAATAVDENGIRYTLSLDGSGNIIAAYSTGKVSSTPSKFTVGGLYYSYNNTRHKIEAIEVSSKASSTTFKASDQNLKIDGWIIGSDPLAGTQAEDKGTTKTGENGGAAITP